MECDMSTTPCRTLTVAALFVVSSLAVAPAVRAEEGLWTFDNLPLEALKQKYQFTPSAAWIEHVQRAAVRFNDGGSGSFVSPEGLVVTNHHVALGQLSKISSDKKDYVKDGFLART